MGPGVGVLLAGVLPCASARTIGNDGDRGRDGGVQDSHAGPSVVALVAVVMREKGEERRIWEEARKRKEQKENRNRRGRRASSCGRSWGRVALGRKERKERSGGKRDKAEVPATFVLGKVRCEGRRNCPHSTSRAARKHAPHAGYETRYSPNTSNSVDYDVRSTDASEEEGATYTHLPS